ncbi:MAG: putative esterase of the alpha-beta hydrolase superfamily [Ilumatobacteraceae bacterium]|nr:putative esterase of the alpha-beta hydrolase superfamily [Ilumatobacteraceae bacterium]
MTETTSTDDGLARPRDFAARSADGLDLAVVLGGGGLFLLAWYVAYLQELKQHGVDLASNDRIVGTSAGAVMATGLTGGKLGRMHRLIETLEKQPGIIARLAPAGDPTPAQTRARDAFWFMTDASPETIRRVGHAALAAPTQSADTTARTLTLVLGMRKWPGANLHTTCMDTYTGERIVVTATAGVSPGRAVAASSAVPGIFSPQPIGDRRCMDGGVSDSGTHMDLAAGARRAVVLALPPLDLGLPDDSARPTDPEAEMAELVASGTEVFHRTPAEVDPEKLMDPAMVPVAFAMGRTQATADADDLRTFLA